MNEGKARAREEEVVYQILQRRFDLLESMRTYEEFLAKKINPSTEFPRLIVALRALFRELEPFIKNKGEQNYNDLKKSIDRIKRYSEIQEVATKLNLFVYEMGLLKIDFYQTPKLKKLED